MIVHRNNIPKKPGIDLGLEIAMASANGRPMSNAEIAAFCGCSRERIRQIEREALQKMRAKFEREGVE